VRQVVDRYYRWSDSRRSWRTAGAREAPLALNQMSRPIVKGRPMPDTVDGLQLLHSLSVNIMLSLFFINYIVMRAQVV